MTGLREKKKHRRREAALRAAERLFRERGYTQTTIEDIAREAELSIGTLYKYFGSKGGVIHELVKPILETMRNEGESIIEDPPPRAEAAIRRLYEAYRFTDDWRSLKLLKAFDPNATGVDRHLQSVAEDFKAIFNEQMGRLLDKLIATSQLRPDLSVDDAVFVLYHHLYAHFLDHVTSDGATTYEATLENLHRRLHLLLSPWTRDAGQPRAVRPTTRHPERPQTKV